MGLICVKKENKSQGSPTGSPKSGRHHLNSIQTKMDKSQYQRLQIIKQWLNSDVGKLPKSPKQKQQQRQISDFKFIRHLGDGSYGQVVMVRDLKSNQLYAMKIIKKDLIIQRDEILNALSQRYILAAMNHPFVVKLHYAFQTKNKIYLIVDLMSGGELFYLLRKNKKFTQQTARFYAAQILLALEYLHSKKIIYRDLKPENILLDPQGHIKLTDFGLSKVFLKKNEVATSVCGTPEYIAPQVLKGKGYSLAADWFSFGSLIYDMLTGKPPFYSKDKEEMMQKIQTKQIPFPDYLSQASKSLLKSLFEKKQQNRLGFKEDAEQIKKHEFFKPISFDDIYNKKLKPPFTFEQNINDQGFAVKFDEFEVEESYEKQIVDKSKGVNFEGFTYQVKAVKHPQSRVQVHDFQLPKDEEKDEDLEMEEAKGHELQERDTKNDHKQKQQMDRTQATTNSKTHKRSTFSMSIHELQKKQNSPDKKQTAEKIQQSKQLQTIHEMQKHSLKINQTLHHDETYSPMRKQQSIHPIEQRSIDETIKK